MVFMSYDYSIYNIKYIHRLPWHDMPIVTSATGLFSRQNVNDGSLARGYRMAVMAEGTSWPHGRGYLTAEMAEATDLMAVMA